MKYAVLTLPLIPLTLAYAIARYRLMDVDIIFRRGYAYTLATLCVLAGFYAVVFSLAGIVQKNFQQLTKSQLMVIMLIAAFLFQPIRNWIQERLDRFFYRDRYDYRRTMIEFARELNSEMNLDRMLTSVADRLMQTLSIRHVSFFLESGRSHRAFRLAKSMGSNGRGPVDPAQLDLSFLNWKRTTALYLLRAHPLPPGRGGRILAGVGAADGRRPGPELLHPLPGAGPHHRVHRREPHRKGRVPFHRGRRTPADPRRLRRHRHRKRQPVPVARDEGRRVRAAQGIQREHRRIDQRRGPGGGSGRSCGELELADGVADRHHPRPGRRASARRGPARRTLRPTGGCSRRNRSPSYL